jgi:hypothetical protein
MRALISTGSHPEATSFDRNQATALSLGPRAVTTSGDRPLDSVTRARSSSRIRHGVGEMTDAEFLAFNEAWMAAVLPHLSDGGILGTFIDWRGLPTVHSAVVNVGFVPLNLIVWAKTNAGMGSLYRSQHELLPLFKKGTRPAR